MLKLTEENIANFRTFYLPQVGKCMEVGNVVRLQVIVRQHSTFVEVTGQSDLVDAFAKARDWLSDAERYEAIHGTGSLFNEKHPLVVAARQKAAERQIVGPFVDKCVTKSSLDSNTSVQPFSVSAA